MSEMNVNRFVDRYRHEFKYFIGVVGTWDYRVLSDIFCRSMKLDPNCRGDRDYWIRSLYFDTLENDDFYEKMGGYPHRKKIRLRIYDTRQQTAKLEIKNKIDQYTYKESSTISRADAEALIAGDTSVLLKGNDPTLNNVYYHMCRDYYRPAVVVDYEREAYVGFSDDIRITFDKNIRGTDIGFDIYDSNLPVSSAFGEETMVLEIKFKEFLPEWIKEILNHYRMGERYAISKYCLSRTINYR